MRVLSHNLARSMDGLVYNLLIAVCAASCIKYYMRQIQDTNTTTATTYHYYYLLSFCINYLGLCMLIRYTNHVKILARQRFIDDKISN